MNDPAYLPPTRSKRLRFRFWRNRVLFRLGLKRPFAG